MIMRFLYLALTAFFSSLPLEVIAADGAVLFKTHCVSCHGATGAGQVAMQAPPLAGLDEAYVTRQLRHFRAGVRGGEGPAATMRAMAQSLAGDADVAALAKYVATLKPVAVRPEAGTSMAVLNSGKAVFAICVACHGNHGEGNSALEAPKLTQLPSWYLIAQLQAFRSGARGAHPDDRLGRQMHQVVAEVLPDDDVVRAVAAYIGSQDTVKTPR